MEKQANTCLNQTTIKSFSNNSLLPILTSTLSTYQIWMQLHDKSTINCILATNFSRVQSKIRQYHIPTLHKSIWRLSGVYGQSDKYDPRNIPESQCAFKILMIHEVLQFALRIAFRCVLHRCGSLDIHC